MIDKKIHEVFGYLMGREIRWHNFEEVGVDDPYYSYYYAEDRLYIIRDNMSDAMWLVKESSPAKALKIIKDRWEELGKAGSYQEEEFYD